MYAARQSKAGRTVWCREFTRRSATLVGLNWPMKIMLRRWTNQRVAQWRLDRLQRPDCHTKTPRDKSDVRSGRSFRISLDLVVSCILVTYALLCKRSSCFQESTKSAVSLFLQTSIPRVRSATFLCEK